MTAGKSANAGYYLISATVFCGICGFSGSEREADNATRLSLHCRDKDVAGGMAQPRWHCRVMSQCSSACPLNASPPPPATPVGCRPQRPASMGKRSTFERRAGDFYRRRGPRWRR